MVGRAENLAGKNKITSNLAWTRLAVDARKARAEHHWNDECSCGLTGSSLIRSAESAPAWLSTEKCLFLDKFDY